MSERLPGPRAASSSSRVSALLLLLLVLLCAMAPAAVAGSSPEAARLLALADRARSAWPEAVFQLRVTVSRPGEEGRPGLFRASVKGSDRLRIDFLDPGEEGKAFVAVGADAWLVMPRAKNPIKVPRSHRLSGGFSAAELLRTRFEEDYDGVVEREDLLDGRPCAVLRLSARPGRSPAWPVARLWVDRKEGLPRRVLFLVASGKTARDITFDSWKEWSGLPGPARLTVVDTLRSGTTVVEYLGAERGAVPDELFDVGASAALARPAP